MVCFFLINVIFDNFVSIRVSVEYTAIIISEVAPVHRHVHALIIFEGKAGKVDVKFQLFRFGVKSNLYDCIFSLGVKVFDEELMCSLAPEYLDTGKLVRVRQ